MKKVFVLCFMMLMALSVGCVSYGPGFGRLCGPGPVNYVDGNACQTVENCGPVTMPCAPNYANSYVRPYNAKPYASPYCFPVARDCAARICYGMQVVGEGALNVVAVPFIVAGNILTGCPGYAPYAGNDCNEIYYGDNCYQPHDYNDPCSPCGTSSQVAPKSGSDCSGCANCSDNIVDGMKYDSQPSSVGIGMPTTYNQQGARGGIRPVSFVAPSRPLTVR